MEPKRSDIDLLTLAIAAIAAAAAAYLTSQVWEGGTLVSAALTPVIVALVKEALARPVDRVTSLRTERSTGAPPVADTPLHPPVTVYGSPNRRWIRVGLVSGLAAFALVVALFTIPELVTGKSIGRSGGSATTLFGGTERKASKQRSPKKTDKSAPGADATPTPTPTAAEETPTPTASPTATATPSPTPTPTVTATPAPSASPAP